MIARVVALFLTACLLAWGFTDTDFDGVDDAVDQCPDTPLTDVVDETGCTVRRLFHDEHFDLVVGLAYSQYNYRTNEATDTVTTDLQLDYYRDAWTFQLLTSYFDSRGEATNENGTNDTALKLYYTYRPAREWTLQVGAGLILPTYDAYYGNNRLDYSLSIYASRSMGEYLGFVSWEHLFVGDRDTATIRYQDIDAVSAGMGRYFGSDLYLSLAYNRSDNLYRSYDAIESLSLHGTWSLTSHWFTTATYAYGLSDTTSDHYVALRVGYYF